MRAAGEGVGVCVGGSPGTLVETRRLSQSPAVMASRAVQSPPVC